MVVIDTTIIKVLVIFMSKALNTRFKTANTFEPIIRLSIILAWK